MPERYTFLFSKRITSRYVPVSETSRSQEDPDMTRIPPLEPPYDEPIDQQLRSMMPPGEAPIALFRTFAKNLAMTRAMGGWGRYELGRDLSLTMRDREIVIDRTCARCGCEYEWGVHIAFFADRVGLTSEQITSLTHGGDDDPCWTDERDRLLVAAVDALHDHADIGDALWARLVGTFTEPELLDLLMLCGWYHAISFTANGARVPLEPTAPRFADVARSPLEPTAPRFADEAR
jgi:alkylhydroperoxidase family enzyme